MSQAKSQRCVFFDRDGVVNISPGKGYVLSLDQFEFNQGIQSVLQMVRKKGWLTVLVTSQRGVGKGLMSNADLDRIHSSMQRVLAQTNASFDAIYSYTETPDCPHQPKPNPEMLISASKDLGIALGQSWLVGDSDRDIQMARAAGLKGCVRFLSDKNPEVSADFTVTDASALKELFGNIL